MGPRGATNPGSGASYGAENYFPGNKMRPGNCYGDAFWELEIVNFFIFRLARNEENVL